MRLAETTPDAEAKGSAWRSKVGGWAGGQRVGGRRSISLSIGRPTVGRSVVFSVDCRPGGVSGYPRVWYRSVS